MQTRHLGLFLSLFVTSLGGLACGGGGGGDDYSGLDTPAAVGRDQGILDPSVCPDTALVLGRPGETLWQSFEVTWRSYGIDGVLGDYLYFVVPDDTLSLAISVEQGTRMTAVNQLLLDGELLMDLRADLAEAPFFHEPLEVATLGLPINASTYPQPGCLAVDVVAYDTNAGEVGKIHVVSRRTPSVRAVIDVNAIVVGDTDILPEELEAAFFRMNDVYAQDGTLAVGDVSFRTLDWPSVFVDAEGRQANELRANVFGTDPFRVNVFFVQDFNEVGTLGIAAGVPGPNAVPGTAASGVIVSVDTHLDDAGENVLGDLLGETLAHEIGHQLGLFHTTEAAGDFHDPIRDTPECGREHDDGDGELSAEECESSGGRNFMFWTAAEFSQHEMTPTQVAVIRDNVVARPEPRP